jgi:hypothetical protein
VVERNWDLVCDSFTDVKKRTRLLLGQGESAQPKEISRHREGGPTQCLLSQVFEELHPGQTDIPRPCGPSWEHPVWFETYRIDCLFVRESRDCPKENKSFCAKKYPTVWELDWAFEVENDPNECVFTLRTLLDVRSEHRVGIFFYSQPQDIKLNELSQAFRDQCWCHLRHPMESWSTLGALFMPDKASGSAQDFASQIRLFVWKPTNKEFVREGC